MNDVVAAPDRPYDNSHRAAQAAQTRAAILDALVRVMARGVADLSMPAVAHEAGVSLRTVYRYFPTKRDLLTALAWHLDERIGYSLTPVPTDPDALVAHIRRYFLALGKIDSLSRAARASQLGREVRDASVSLKLQALDKALEPIAGSLDEPVRTHLFRVLSALWSQYTLQLMEGDLGITAEQAADSVVWAVQTLIRAATTGEGAAAP